MQFVGIGKLIDIVCENKNYINFVTEADVVIVMLKCTLSYTILLVPHKRENKPNLLL